ncbi:hypothetical protein ACERII_19680 [Evansella sp. AB-rgal1]|uniref:hypothetical protein n=1 Tax=Evansella sp. AB-rgal1 TaxID=3242696 RepID=UPI00359CF220
MEITFRRDLTRDEREKVRVFVGFYRGNATFIANSFLEITPKHHFSEQQFLKTLYTLNIPIQNVDATR